MGRRSASPRRSPRHTRPRSRSGSIRGGRNSSPPKRSRSRSRNSRRVRSRSRDRRPDRSSREPRRSRRSRSTDRSSREPISLLVRNLSPETTADELRRAFERRTGDILDVYLPKEFNSNRPRGFAFIEFADSRVGRDVKFEMDRSQIGGREIAVLFAKQHRKSPQEMRRILNLPADRSPRRSSRRRSKSRSRSGSQKRLRRSNSAGRKRDSVSPRRSPRASPSPRRSPRASLSPRRSPRASLSPRRSPRASLSPRRSPRGSPSPRRASPSPNREKRSADRSMSPNDRADETIELFQQHSIDTRSVSTELKCEPIRKGIGEGTLCRNRNGKRSLAF
uniref:RRM domain-containing protein n=1 Tax=Peronospora matthiolae TaxID=2874970 RepID=A0AAV1UA34_9STRA